MSNREFAKTLIDQIPENRLFYVISYLQGAAVPDETPNAETIEAFTELDNGGGHPFNGTTEKLFSELMEE
ncbi:MAG: hypothetical protein HFF47_07510 [Lawsonibacter sp.]|nr:hypothetical protein [Lawsonibacter sp.]